MIDLSPEIITILMLGGVLVGVLTGFYLAVAVGGVALVIGLLTLGDSAIQIMYLRIYAMAHNYTLAAVPPFVFMGAMLQHSGIADSLYTPYIYGLAGSGVA